MKFFVHSLFLFYMQLETSHRGNNHEFHWLNHFAYRICENWQLTGMNKETPFPGVVRTSIALVFSSWTTMSLVFSSSSCLPMPKQLCDHQSVVSEHHERLWTLSLKVKDKHQQIMVEICDAHLIDPDLCLMQLLAFETTQQLFRV